MSTSVSTSRVGRKPVTIPKGVVVNVNGQVLAIKGPKGEVHYDLSPFVSVVLEDDLLKFETNLNAGYCRKGSGLKTLRASVGTARAQIANIMVGVTQMFEKKLLLVGVGYKALSKGKILNLTLGYSHPIDFPVPEGITVETPIPTEIIVKGMDKNLVGLVASKIRDFRGPEPYKGKGIRYSDEVIIRKETKKK